MIEDVIRFAAAWGGCAALVFFWYWVMGNIIAAVQNVGINWYLDNKEKREAAIGEGTVK